MRWTVVGSLLSALALTLCPAEELSREELQELKQTLRQSLLKGKMDEAVAAVTKIGSGDSKASALVLLGLAHNSPPQIYEAARAGLAGMSSGEVDTMISRKCKLGRAEEQLLLADALEQRGGSFASLALGTLLDSPDPRVVRGALVAIERAKLADARGALETWLQGAPPTHAARLLGLHVLHELSGGEAGEAAPGATCAGAPVLGEQIVFVLDTSAGMAKDDRLAKAKATLLAAIQALAPEQRFTVLAYSGHTLEGLAEPELERGAYPPTVGGVTWLRSLGERVEFAKPLWLEKAQAFVDGLQPAEEDAFVLRALEAAVSVPLAEAVVLISGGDFSDVDHARSERHSPESLLAGVRAANRYRRVVINVRSFSGASPALAELAAQSGGTYVELE
ncbi:MAG: hypothetical protein KDD82_12540 [Planctomycetes bacterium]|nr:hypothetical protein [Planctomycetota bacterium]